MAKSGRASAPLIAYRYAAATEVRVVRATTPWRVPNFDRMGRPKIVYMTWDLYDLAGEAELALRIGAYHQAGPFPSPIDRLDLDLTGVDYTDAGTVPDGTGSEVTTTDSPLVVAITGLAP